MKEFIGEVTEHRIDLADLRRLRTFRPSSVGVEIFVGIAKVGKGCERTHLQHDRWA